MIRRLLLALLLGCSLTAGSISSALAVDTPRSGSRTCGAPGFPCTEPNEPRLPERTVSPTPDLPEGAGITVDPRAGRPPNRPQAAGLDGFRRRAQARLDVARRRLARAERLRAIAASRRLRELQLANARRARANRLRERAERAQRRADAAERQMVAERREAHRQVQARRAAHTTELLDWLGGRVSAFALSVWLLLMAFLAAGWRPVVGWLALRRARGLDRGTYAKALALAAATMAGGAAAISALSPTLDGALSPVAVPVIAAGVTSIGVIAWRSSTVSAGSTGVPVALAGRRAVPGMAVVLTLVLGLGIGLMGLLSEEPAEQRVAPKTAALARLAQPDPTANPTKRVARLRMRAERADRHARRAEASISTAESALPP